MAEEKLSNHKCSEDIIYEKEASDILNTSSSFLTS